MSESYAIIRYNAPLQPLHRAYFEDPLEDFLRAANMGDITGGGSQMKEDGIKYSETEIKLRSRGHIPAIIAKLEALGAPKGSLFIDEYDGSQTPFGVDEALAIHLNGTDLPAEVYAECDDNALIAELQTRMGSQGRILTFWRGRRETSLYFYGPSFEAMRAATTEFLATHPGCQQCRVEQVA